jgi:hypothetical protein
MQPLEVALSAAVIALAVTLVGAIVWPHLKARRAPAAVPVLAPAAGVAVASAAPLSVVGLICPACHREYEPGLQFCPHDARDLVRIGDPAARGTAPGAACPNCKRSYDASKKFCAFDGEELVPLATLGAGAGDLPPASIAGSLGKICPSCSRRYESEATFCGRDGAELVSVN